MTHAKTNMAAGYVNNIFIVRYKNIWYSDMSKYTERIFEENSL